MNSKLAIAIPTYNRPNNVKRIIDSLLAQEALSFDLTVCIFDSSEDDLTQEAVRSYRNDRILYERMDASFDVDEKTLRAVKEIDADFVWLCGDRYIPQVKNVFEKIDFEGREDEIIALYDSRWKPQHNFYRKNISSESYSSAAEFAELHFWQLILYGGSICKRELLDLIDVESCVADFNKTGFIYPCALLSYAHGPFSCREGIFLDVIGGESSGWINRKTAIKIWTENLCTALEKMQPRLGEEVCRSIVSTTGKRTGFLTAKGLMRLKCSGNYNKKIYKEYRNSIRLCRACSAFSAKFLAYLPDFPFVLLRKIYRRLKGKNRGGSSIL